MCTEVILQDPRGQRIAGGLVTFTQPSLSVVNNNTQEVLSRQVTPEAGAFDFTCDNSLSQQGNDLNSGGENRFT